MTVNHQGIMALASKLAVMERPDTFDGMKVCLRRAARVFFPT